MFYSDEWMAIEEVWSLKITLAKAWRAVIDHDYALNVLHGHTRQMRLQAAMKFGLNNPPHVITMFLTTNCNLRCYMCAQYGERGTNKAHTVHAMPYEIALKTLKDVAGFKPYIVLMGGEPLLYKHWKELIRSIKERGMNCELITNGTTLVSDAEELVRLGIDKVVVSLDGLGDIHDQSRGVAGAFNKAVAGIDKLVTFRQHQNAVLPDLVASFVINKFNYSHLVEFAEWASLKGFSRVNFNHLRFYTLNEQAKNTDILNKTFKKDVSGEEGFIFDPGIIDPTVLKSQLAEITTRNWPISIHVLPEHPLDTLDEYYTFKDFVRHRTSCCTVPWSNATILSDGSVTPCMSITCGNIMDQNFLDIWNGQCFKTFRKLILKEGLLPLCNRCCI